MAVTVIAPDGRVWRVRRLSLPFGESPTPSPPDELRDGERGPLGWDWRKLRAPIGCALALVSGLASLVAFLHAGAGAQTSVLAALVVAAVLGTSPYWIVALAEEIAFRLVLYTAVVWVPVLVLALVLFYLSRFVGDRPWTVEAVSSEPTWSVVRWKVRGWSRSGRAAHEVANALARGEQFVLPAGTDGVPETVSVPWTRPAVTETA